jgi:hypothetical protein
LKLAGALAIAGTLVAACTEPDHECWWVDAEPLDQTVVLGTSDTEIGHFTVITRRAPAHQIELRLTIELAAAEETPFEFVVAPEPATTLSGGEPAVGILLAGRAFEITRAIHDAQRECLPDCEDGFGLILERLDSTDAAPITADWSVSAQILGCVETGPDPDAELEIRLD